MPSAKKRPTTTYSSVLSTSALHATCVGVEPAPWVELLILQRRLRIRSTDRKERGILVQDHIRAPDRTLSDKPLPSIATLESINDLVRKQELTLKRLRLVPDDSAVLPRSLPGATVIAVLHFERQAYGIFEILSYEHDSSVRVYFDGNSNSYKDLHDPFHPDTPGCLNKDDPTVYGTAGEETRSLVPIYENLPWPHAYTLHSDKPWLCIRVFFFPDEYWSDVDHAVPKNWSSRQQALFKSHWDPTRPWVDSILPRPHWPLIALTRFITVPSHYAANCRFCLALLDWFQKFFPVLSSEPNAISGCQLFTNTFPSLARITSRCIDREFFIHYERPTLCSKEVYPRWRRSFLLHEPRHSSDGRGSNQGSATSDDCIR